MPLFQYRCVYCHHVTELFRPVGRRDERAICEACEGPAGVIFSPPVLGLRSIGRDQATLLTPVHRWKPTDDLSERRIRDAAARDIGRVHFGYGTSLPETGGGPKRSAEPRESE
jgi:putative FmdB family regulatory protein